MNEHAEEAANDAEAAWEHAEEHHWSDDKDNQSLKVDYLRAIAAELRAVRLGALREEPT